ncbi:MAG: hypothetical protein ABEJ36_00320 [Candidatus Nanosalina sp.]
MSEAEEQQEVEGVSWEHELEDDALAEAQAKIENEFGADFEEMDPGMKGIAQRNNLPFYTDVEDTMEFLGEEVEISIERSGGLNTVEFWVDDPEMMEAVDHYFEKYTSSNGGEAMLEPYVYEEVKDTKVRDLLADFSEHFQMKGPERRPGNGQPRIHPVRREHMEDEHLGEMEYGREDELVLQEPEENEAECGEVEEAEYTGREGYIPGDAQFQIEGLDVEEEPVDHEVDGRLSIKPLSRETGFYDLKLKSEDQRSLTYLINRAARTLEGER